MKGKVLKLLIAGAAAAMTTAAFAAAASAAEGEVMTDANHYLTESNYYLDADITTSSQFNVWSYGSVTVDLNGHTLTCSGNYGISNQYGTLTVIDSVGGGSISAGFAGVRVTNGAIANIAGGTVSGNSYGVYSEDDSTVNITGGTITGSVGVSLNGGSLTVDGGAVTGTDFFGIYATGGTTTINSGTALGYQNGFYNPSGSAKLNVTGGTVSCLGYMAGSASNYGGIKSDGDLTCTISGGTVSGDYTDFASDGSAGSIILNGSYDVDISGGTFSRPATISANDGSTVDITGGSFTSDVSIASGADVNISGGSFKNSGDLIKYLNKTAAVDDNGTVMPITSLGNAASGTYRTTDQQITIEEKTLKSEDTAITYTIYDLANRKNYVRTFDLGGASIDGDVSFHVIITDIPDDVELMVTID